MTDPITIHVRQIDGDILLDSQALTLAFGVDVAAVKALPVVDGVSRIPREWARRGKRRAAEASAHTGSEALLDALRYWARRDHNADLQVIYE
ncbi:hypothetical protein KQR54_26130 [Mycobacterium gordonae]|uniref:hypothetical protein n=1 Tax=Mycobacterium gordonae TaxID=1778 RepID=UPI00210CDC47|nr:hypothetical protein [Mycobacterium gordonae]MCQ4364561.1 hypothetical protein [Mycobacterium gordonae]